MGQCVLIARNLCCMNGPMRGLVPQIFQAAVGQLEVIGNTSALVSWANARISLSSHLADPYSG